MVLEQTVITVGKQHIRLIDPVKCEIGCDKYSQHNEIQYTIKSLFN